MAEALETLFVEVRAIGDKFDANIKAIEARLRSFEGAANTSTATVGKAFASLTSTVGFLTGGLAAIGGVAALGGLTNLAVQALDTADALGDTSERLGVGVEALQEYRFAAEQSGSSQEALDAGLQKLGINLAEFAATGKGPAAAAFKTLGISAEEARTQFSSIETVLPQLAEGFKNTENQAQRLALAQDLLGRGAVSLVPLLSRGKEGIDDLAQSAHEAGGVIGKDLIDQAGELQNEFTAASKAIKNEFTRALIELAPYLVAATQGTAALVHQVSEFARGVGLLGTGKLQQATADVRGAQEELAALQRDQAIVTQQLQSLTARQAAGDTSRMLGRQIEALQRKAVDLAQAVFTATEKLHDYEGALKDLQPTAAAAALLPPPIAPDTTGTIDKAAQALAKLQKEARAHLQTLQQQQTLLAQVQAGTLTYEAALHRVAVAEEVAKGTNQDLAEQLVTAQETTARQTRSIEDAARAWDQYQGAQQQSRAALSDHLTALEADITALQEQETALRDGIATGRTRAEVDRDLAAATITRKEALGELTQEEAALARQLLAAKEGVYEAERAFDRLGVTTVDLGEKVADASRAIVSGILLGTREAEDILGTFQDLVVGTFADMFASTIQQKLRWETQLSGNLLNDLPALFGQAAGLAGHSFLGSLTSAVGVGGIAGALTGSPGGGLGAGLGSLATSLGLFGSQLAGLGVSLGTSLASGLGIGLSTALSIGGSVSNMILPGIGLLVGFLADTFIGDLFAHTPTKGTQIRTSMVAWLEDIGVSFADAVSSQDYFFEGTKKLADQLGSDFLTASQEVLAREAGPALARQLQALGTFLTAEQARELGKSLEQTGTTFGNLLVDNLGIDAIPAAIAEIVQKAGIDLGAVVGEITTAFAAGEIGVEFYKDAILGAVDLFTTDLPAGIDISRLALASFTADGIFSLETFQEKVTDVVENATLLGAAFSDKLLEGLQQGLDPTAAGQLFADFLRQSLAEAAVAELLAQQLPALLAGIDLTQPLQPEQLEALRRQFEALYATAQTIYHTFVQVDAEFSDAARTLAGILTPAVVHFADVTGTALQKMGADTQKWTDNLKMAATQLGQLGILSSTIVGAPVPGTPAPIGFGGLIAAGGGGGGGGATLDTSALVSTVDLMAEALAAFQSFVDSHTAPTLTSQLVALQQEADALSQQLITAAQAAARPRLALQEIQDELTTIADLTAQAQLDLISDALADIPGQVADANAALIDAGEAFSSLSDSIRADVQRLLTGPGSPLSSFEQLAALQRQEAELRTAVGRAELTAQPDLLAQLAENLQAQLGTGAFQASSQEALAQFYRTLADMERIAGVAETTAQTVDAAMLSETQRQTKILQDMLTALGQPIPQTVTISVTANGADAQPTVLAETIRAALERELRNGVLTQRT
jgi:hypothetical protein